jgi:hypothetical protein
MKHNRPEQAFPGVVVEPDDKDAKWDHSQALPYDPGWRMLPLDIRHDVPHRPHEPYNDAGFYGAPSILHPIDGISLRHDAARTIESPDLYLNIYGMWPV